MLYNPHDIFIGRSFDLYAEFSESEVDLFRRIIQPGSVVLDIGANIGAHSVALARIVGPGGVVHAFEPQRILFQTLCANLALNSLPNVLPYHTALGSRPGKAHMPFFDYTSPANFGGVAVDAFHEGETVAIGVLDRANLPRCDFAKIDVEGFESEVLLGAADTIDRMRPILYVENDRKEKSQALIQLLTEMRYRLWWHVAPFFNPENFSGETANPFGAMKSINMLCIPKEHDEGPQGLPEVTGPEDWWYREGD